MLSNFGVESELAIFIASFQIHTIPNHKEDRSDQTEPHLNCREKDVQHICASICFKNRQYKQAPNMYRTVF